MFSTKPIAESGWSKAVVSKDWKKIIKELPNRVLVTNNIKARDAKGGMSHVWIAFIIKSSDPQKYGKFMAFDAADRPIYDLTHYCEVPMP